MLRRKINWHHANTSETSMLLLLWILVFKDFSIPKRIQMFLKSCLANIQMLEKMSHFTFYAKIKQKSLFSHYFLRSSFFIFDIFLLFIQDYKTLRLIYETFKCHKMTKISMKNRLIAFFGSFLFISNLLVFDQLDSKLCLYNFYSKQI